MTIEEIPITSREQWLTARHQDVTASQAAALLGIHPYVSAFQLYAEKSVPLDLGTDEVSGPMERGLLLEPVAVAKLQRDHRNWRIWTPSVYSRDPATRMGATPDAFVDIPNRTGFGVIQFKSVEPSVFKRKWFNEAKEVEPPLWIVVQANIEAHLTGASYAYVAALVIGFAVEVHLIEIPLVPSLITRIEGEVAEFWQRVANRKPPDVTSPADADVLAAIYATPGGTIDLRGDNELLELAHRDAELRARIKQDEEDRKVIKGRFLAALQGAGLGTLSDGSCIIARRVDRKSYTVKETSFITVTHKEPT